METHQPLEDLTVLLLEDELLIALDMEETLREFGISKIEIISTCADAELWIEKSYPSVAIVDPGLRDGTCAGVVRRLVERDIPFIVHSGNVEDVAEKEPSFRSGVWLSKPSPPEDLIAAIRMVLGQTETAR
jgi:DNA-binding response OmpR family regulator